MAHLNLTTAEANGILARGRSSYDHYRGRGNLNRNGQTRKTSNLHDEPRGKSQKQLEREIVGDSIKLGSRKAWSPGNVKFGGQAIKLEPRLSLGTSRDIKVVSANGKTTINLRVASLSRTSKRHSASEGWHSVAHAQYLEREEAVATIQLELTPASASDYIERDTAVASHDGDIKAIYSNISSTDAAERRRFWELVEAHEPEGGENELTIDMSVAGSIARSVASDKECPEDLRRDITKASADEVIKYAAGDHLALRSIFLRHGWSKPEKAKRRSKKDGDGPAADRALGTPGIKFRDSRAGRTQIQSNGEIPAELSLKGKAKIAKRLHDWFDKRSLRVTVVLHAPDYKNSERNWHFHFAAYDRPCQRFDNNAESLPRLPDDFTPAQEKARQKALSVIGSQELAPYIGEWDFAVPMTYRTSSRNLRTSFPFEQNKDRSINDDKFIDAMRELLVKLCNEELEREGFQPRYDHRTYKLMGISKEADEHLSKNAAQLEKFGIPTEKGVANEGKQWAYIIAKLDHDHSQGIERIDSAYDKYSKKERSESLAASEKASPSADRWRALVYSAQDTLRVQRELEQLIERAKSRAAKTIKACRLHLEAIQTGSAPAGEISNRELYEKRLDLAQDHLTGVELHFKQQSADIEKLERQRIETMKHANEQLNLIIDAVRLPRRRDSEVAIPEQLRPADRQPGRPLLAVTSAVDSLISAFRSAKSDEERRRVATFIRSTPAALKAMNKAGDKLWKLEQKRFDDLQIAARLNAKGRGD